MPYGCQITFPIPDWLAGQTDHKAVVLSNRIAVVWWGTSAKNVLVFFEGKLMSSIKRLTWEADSEEGVSLKIVLIQTPTYKQPQDFIDDLLNCGFTVTIEDVA